MLGRQIRTRNKPFVLKKCLLCLSRECEVFIYKIIREYKIPSPSFTNPFTYPPECQSLCPWGCVNVLSLLYLTVLYFILILACNVFSCSRPPWQVTWCKLHIELIRLVLMSSIVFNFFRISQNGIRTWVAYFHSLKTAHFGLFGLGIKRIPPPPSSPS